MGAFIPVIAARIFGRKTTGANQTYDTASVFRSSLGCCREISPTAKSEIMPLGLQGDSGIRHKESDDDEGKGSNSGGSRNGEHPGPYNPLRYAPAHGRKTSCRSYTNDCAGNGMRGADRNAVKSQ